MEGLINTDAKIESIANNENIEIEHIPVLEEDQTEILNTTSLGIEKEQNTIKNTTEEVSRIRKELGLEGEENNIPSIEPNKNKEIKLKGVLSKFTKIAAVGAGMFVGSNNIEASNLNKNISDKFEQKIENVSNADDGKTIKGGNIEEVVVYGKKKYEEELNKQQENIKKFESEMGKYKKDSVEWTQVNEAYKDSLKAFNDMPNIDPKTGLPRFLNHHADRLEESIPFTHTVADEISFYKKHPDHGWAYSDEKDALGRNWNDSKILPEKIVYWGGPKTKKFDKNAEDWNTNNGHLGLGIAVYKKPTNEPIPPQKPENIANKEIKYDPKFEDLRMRSLWATILKQNPNEKIGTLHVLDPLFEKGFTLDEAMTFPQEIKDQYNIDYIYNQIHGKESGTNIKTEYKHPGWNYENPQE